MSYHVYILSCADGTLYCGSTNNLVKRLKEHNHLKQGARYTRARRPVALVYTEAAPTVGAARSREAALKRLTRKQKLDLIREKGRATLSS